MNSTAKNDVRLTEEKGTLLITLYAKAIDICSPTSVLHDSKADEVLGMIDYNFTKLQRSKHNSTIISVRAKQIGEWIEEFLRTNPHSVVLPPDVSGAVNVSSL